MVIVFVNAIAIMLMNICNNTIRIINIFIVIVRYRWGLLSC